MQEDRKRKQKNKQNNKQMKVIYTSSTGIEVTWDGSVMQFTADMACCSDGSPTSYAPNNKGDDYTANAGHPGDWWGVVTKNGNPVIQNGVAPQQPNKGYYISCTAYFRSKYQETDVRRWLDARVVPYVVVTSGLRSKVPPIVLGCRATVEYNGKIIECVTGEIGPDLGEASQHVCSLFGLSPNPKNGGSSERVFKYKIYPGVPAFVNGEQFQLIPA